MTSLKGGGLQGKLSPMTSLKGGGVQGKLSPSGSDITALRPSVVMVSPVAASTMTKVGMPRTLNFLERAPLTSRLSYGTAAHGCSAKYSSNEPASLSEEAKT